MILKVLERLFNIDDIDCKWGVRFMFLFCVLARCAVFFNPYSDTDFSWLNAWKNNFESADQTTRLTMDVPMTSGNVVFRSHRDVHRKTRCLVGRFKIVHPSIKP